MKLTFIVLCAVVLIKQHKASIMKIRHFRDPNLENHKLIVSPRPTNTKEVLNINWISQRLDNFNSSNTRLWKMRYLCNERFSESDGPIFIIVGGQEEISTTPLISGHFHDLAKKYKAVIFHTEHRFYGQSKPTSDMSTASLKYLTSKQALADLAHFIETLKTSPKFKNSKVILYGEGYSGSLVVWFRRLYPHLVDGGWASTAPILAKTDVSGFDFSIGAAIVKRSSLSCYNRITNGISELKKLYKDHRSDEAKTRFQLCDDFTATSNLDIASLFLSILYEITKIVMEGTISATCNSASNNGEDDLTTIANLISHKFKRQGCVHVSYNDTIQGIINPTRMRAYQYQLCNEFGWFVYSANSELLSENIDLSYYIKICQDAFGMRYTLSYITEKIRQTNDVYGGLYPNVKNVYFTQGALDPWKYLTELQATRIPGAMQGGDNLSISSRDSTEVKMSKELIDQLIRKWIN